MWFKTFLSDRKFKVKIGNEFSDLHSVTHGVPQGSVLGPAVFSLYTQELHNITDK